MGKKKNVVLIVVMTLLIFGLSDWCRFKKPTEFSESERRDLAKAPTLSVDTIMDGSYMKDFESYTVDQFPMRDTFRGIKSGAEFFVFNKLDNNDLYIKDGYLAKKEYPLSEKMIDHAAEKFNYIYDSYLKDTDTNVYFSVVPDKNCFLAENSVRLSLDVNEVSSKLMDKTGFAEYVDITDLLSIEDYYRTDTHWRQECITDVAERLCKTMGADYTGNFREVALDTPFKGVYYGQVALPITPDDLKYLTSDVLEECTVTYYNDKGMPYNGEMYNMERSTGRDPYEMFLSGTQSVIVIENPTCTSGKELVVLRDSFGSSLTPLLAEGYSKITILDIRYLRSDLLGLFVDFSDQDVLFIYSTLILNNSLALN